MRIWTTREQDVTGTGLAVERVQKFANSGVGSKSTSTVRIEQVFKLIENDEARRVRSICCIERIESGISLILWRQTG